MHRPDYGAGRNRLDPVEGHEDPSTSHSVLFELTKWGTLNGLAQQIEAYGAIDSLTTIRERVSSPSELPLSCVAEAPSCCRRLNGHLGEDL